MMTEVEIEEERRETISAEQADAKMQQILNSFQDLNPSRQEESINNPNMREEILHLIEKIYFEKCSKNISEHELKKYLNNPLNKTDIKSQSLKLQLQLQIVSRKMSDLILRNSGKCARQLQNVTELKELLESSGERCGSARRHLNNAQATFTHSLLSLLRHELKRKHFYTLLKSLNAVKSLQRKNTQINELISSESFPQAIEMCIEAQNEADAFDASFKCIADLKNKIIERVDQLEETLDEKSAALCLRYDRKAHFKLIESYELLGKANLFVDQLGIHFAAACNSTAQSTLISFVQLNTSDNLAELRIRQFKVLCEMLQPSQYFDCLSTLCVNLWALMKNHLNVFMAFKEKLEMGESQLLAYVKSKFESAKLRLWQEVQSKVNVCFRAMNLYEFKFDAFMDLIEINNRLIQIGQEYCQSQNFDCTSLMNATKDQTLAYFKSYHISRLEELKMFLETEMWQWCPVKASFSIAKLHEFKFMRAKLTKSARLNRASNEKSPSPSLAIPPRPPPPPSSQKKDDLAMSAFISEIFHTENPFHLQTNRVSETDNTMQVLSDDENDDKSVEVLRKSGSNSSLSSQNEVPIVTNTTLNVIRLFGKYLNIANTFHLIAFDIIVQVMQLFHFYLYYIYINFAQREVEINKSIISEPLHNLISSIRNELFIQNKLVDEPSISQSSIKQIKNREDYISCLKERFVAAESLVFLATQLDNLLPHFNEINNNPQVNHTRNFSFLEQFSAQLKEVQGLRAPIYMFVARFSCNYSLVFDSICKVNWDLHEIMSEHNAYIDILLHQIKGLVDDVDALKSVIPINRAMKYSLLEQVIRIIMRMLVDGYAQAKKCTNEGRALMQLDFQQFIVKLEKLCEIRPIPERDFVEVYIKAFYLPENSIEKWSKEHTEYSTKHIVSLINVMAQITRKTRLNLANLFEIN